MNILVVDDEDLIRETLKAFLEAKGCVVAEAASAEEALAVLSSTPVDMAVVDMRLPGKNGTEFILEAHARRPDLKFLIFTGSAEYTPSEELVGIGLGAGDVLRKPLTDLTVLHEALNRCQAPKEG